MPMYTHTNIPIHWTSNQFPSREWTWPLESNGMPQCPYNLASSRSIAYYVNEYLLTANEHYEQIPTWCCRQNMRLKNGNTTSLKRASLPVLPRAMLQPLQGKSWEKRTSKWWIQDAKRAGNHSNGRSSVYPETTQGALYPDHLQVRHHLPSFPNSISKWPPTIQKVPNWLGSVYQNDRHANFSDQHPVIQLCWWIRPKCNYKHLP